MEKVYQILSALIVVSLLSISKHILDISIQQKIRVSFSKSLAYLKDVTKGFGISKAATCTISGFI